MKFIIFLFAVLVAGGYGCKDMYPPKTDTTQDTAQKPPVMAVLVRQSDIDRLTQRNTDQDKVITKSVNDIISIQKNFSEVNSSMIALKADTAAKGRSIRAIQDTLKSYRNLVKTLNGVQFIPDKNGVISIPDLILIKAAVIKAGLLK